MGLRRRVAGFNVGRFQHVPSERVLALVTLVFLVL